jgi:hypothetical protein
VFGCAKETQQRRIEHDDEEKISMLAIGDEFKSLMHDVHLRGDGTAIVIARWPAPFGHYRCTATCTHDDGFPLCTLRATNKLTEHFRGPSEAKAYRVVADDAVPDGAASSSNSDESGAAGGQHDPRARVGTTFQFEALLDDDFMRFRLRGLMPSGGGGAERHEILKRIPTMDKVPSSLGKSAAVAAKSEDAPADDE